VGVDFFLGQSISIDNLSVMGVRVANFFLDQSIANLFLDQSIGMDENNTFQLKFLRDQYISVKIFCLA